MKPVVEFLVSGTGRRLLVFLIGFLTVTLNKKLGLDLNAESLVADIVMALGYITQSAVKEASDNHAAPKMLVAEAAIENAATLNKNADRLAAAADASPK